MKRVLIAAAAAAVLATSALAGVAPANAAEVASASVVKVNGPGHWNGNGNWNNGRGNWNNGHGKWQGQQKWRAKRSCDPIVRWRLIGPRWDKRWDRVIVGWDCNRHKRW